MFFFTLNLYFLSFICFYNVEYNRKNCESNEDKGKFDQKKNFRYFNMKLRYNKNFNFLKHKNNKRNILFNRNILIRKYWIIFKQLSFRFNLL